MRLAIFYNLREKSCAEIKSWRSYSNPRDQITPLSVPPLYPLRAKPLGRLLSHFLFVIDVKKISYTTGEGRYKGELKKTRITVTLSIFNFST